MDKHQQLERQILDAALAKAAQIGVRFEVIEHPGVHDTGLDATLLLRTQPDQLRYGVEIKQHLRPGALGPILQKLRSLTTRPLLIATDITPPMAETLRAQGVEFLDTAGNAFLKEPPFLHVFVKGQKGAFKAPGDVPTRAFRPAGLQVIFALLAQRGFEARPYREIGAAAGVATGAVGMVMAELPRHGFLVEVKNERRLLNRAELIDRWAEGYVRTLRPKLLLGRFAADVDDVFRRVFAHGETCVGGGETAGAHLTHHLRPVTTTLYADVMDAALVARFRLRQDPQGKVDVRRRFWRFKGDQPCLAPTLLIYGDLLAIGDDRCIETARILRERYID